MNGYKLTETATDLLLPPGFNHSWLVARVGFVSMREDGFMAHKMNVESFNLDHTKVAAPFVRVADVKHLPAGDTLTKYDVRFCQPNKEHLDMPAVHSLEHSFAECVRNHSDAVIDFGPMGCQTGFYLIMIGEPDVSGTCELVETTLRDILKLNTTPAANEVQCGWGANHSIKAAQEAAHDAEPPRRMGTGNGLRIRLPHRARQDTPLASSTALNYEDIGLCSPQQ